MKIVLRFIFVGIIMNLNSCTEIIDIDTNEADSELIVEATIREGESAVVLLSHSVALDTNNPFPSDAGSVITISDIMGNTEELTRIKSGRYESHQIKGISGNTYSLKIVSQDRTITASSTIPERVPLDSVKVIRLVYPGIEASPGQKASFYQVRFYYKDPPNTASYYRAELGVNQNQLSGIHVWNDDFNNGKNAEASILFYNTQIKAGDILDIEFFSIDKPVYNYFNSFYSGGMGATPANPVTNLTGTKLGYFSAYTSEKRKISINR